MMMSDLRRRLSESDRCKIIELWESGGYNYAKLGRMFGVAHTTIMRIVNPEFRDKKNEYNAKNWRRYKPTKEKHAVYMRMYRARKGKS